MTEPYSRHRYLVADMTFETLTNAYDWARKENLFFIYDWLRLQIFDIRNSKWMTQEDMTNYIMGW